MSDVEKFALASQSVDNLRSSEPAAAGVPGGIVFAPGAFEDAGEFRVPASRIVGIDVSARTLSNMMRQYAILYGVMFKVEYIFEADEYLITWRPDETTPTTPIERNDDAHS